MFTFQFLKKSKAIKIVFVTVLAFNFLSGCGNLNSKNETEELPKQEQTAQDKVKQEQTIEGQTTEEGTTEEQTTEIKKDAVDDKDPNNLVEFSPIKLVSSDQKPEGYSVNTIQFSVSNTSDHTLSFSFTLGVPKKDDYGEVMENGEQNFLRFGQTEEDAKNGDVLVDNKIAYLKPKETRHYQMSTTITRAPKEFKAEDCKLAIDQTNIYYSQESSEKNYVPHVAYAKDFKLDINHEKKVATLTNTTDKYLSQLIFDLDSITPEGQINENPVNVQYLKPGESREIDIEFAYGARGNTVKGPDKIKYMVDPEKNDIK